MKKPFTIKEANKLLPRIKKLVSQAMLTIAVMDQLQTELVLISRVIDKGIDIREITTRRVQIDELEEKFNQTIKMIKKLGVIVVGTIPFTIHFPAKWKGKKIWFCWKYGEEIIEFYHEAIDCSETRRKLSFLSKTNQAI